MVLSQRLTFAPPDRVRHRRFVGPSGIVARCQELRLLECGAAWPPPNGHEERLPAPAKLGSEGTPACATPSGEGSTGYERVSGENTKTRLEGFVNLGSARQVAHREEPLGAKPSRAASRAQYAPFRVVLAGGSACPTLGFGIVARSGRCGSGNSEQRRGKQRGARGGLLRVVLAGGGEC